MQDSEKKNKKRIWLRCIAFFLVLGVLLDVVSNAFLYTAVSTKDAKILNRNAAETDLLSQDEDSLDVLIIGDSEAYSSFSPLQIYHDTGITSFVASQGAQTIEEMKHMLTVALSTQHPKVVILETDAIYRSYGSVSGIESFLEDGLSTLFPVFQYHNIWKMLGENDYAKYSSWKGYYLNGAVAPCTSLSSYMSSTDQQYKIPWLNQLVLEQIKQEVEDAGAQLILVSAPTPVNFSMGMHNYLKQLAEDWDVTYIDFNAIVDEIGIDWNKDTRDAGDHLNDSGAWKVTDYLISILETMDLPDHRGDSAYSSWDEMAEQFLEQVNANIKQINSQS
ncbi:MAG: SGNH/GDSL hydrolase family protein [Erysipelotrichaceae bacterium]|jgi:hypothetical protein|nr:SGNH/GDSL hydrolase family protein [Erysipelotrichaceae bacterium]MCI1325780.1 SGNH/GDSL hydrolase family protein [Solobacterium sp.]MCH4043949.1 SGNH/GDSL hydrolase family protein [Erysipelotrichaceae bacterium]MCH4121164.1 SGNH/GDSL hydrolase family protein [Erysipelotrichaceae bacterium]MCI1362374.1 SGNH/GDSL hydrolase family protein [Solobacterium sp.]